MSKPWHLIPQDIRERSALANLDSDAGDGHSCGQTHTNDPCDCDIRAEAFAAAAQLLRDAAPYPDEALAFEVACGHAAGEHVEMLEPDGHLDAQARVRFVDGVESLCWPSELRPLTIAAHEMWIDRGGDE